MEQTQTTERTRTTVLNGIDTALVADALQEAREAKQQAAREARAEGHTEGAEAFDKEADAFRLLEDLFDDALHVEVLSTRRQ